MTQLKKEIAELQIDFNEREKESRKFQNKYERLKS